MTRMEEQRRRRWLSAGLSPHHVEMSAGRCFRLSLSLLHIYMVRYSTLHASSATDCVYRCFMNMVCLEMLSISPRSLDLCHESSSVPVSDQYRRTIVFGSSGVPAAVLAARWTAQRKSPRDHTWELLHTKNRDLTSNNPTVQNVNQGGQNEESPSTDDVEVQCSLSRCICKDEQSRAGVGMTNKQTTRAGRREKARLQLPAAPISG